MNLVGKIFTVLIFLMSVVFATFALAVYTTHKNWRTVVDNPTHPLGLSQQLDNAQKEKKTLEDKKKQLEDQCKVERDRYDKMIAQLETENDKLHNEQVANAQTIAKLETSARDAVQAMRAVHETLAGLRKQTDQLRVDIKAAREDRDQKFKEVIRLTDELHNAVNERMRLEKANRDLAEQLVKARECLTYNKLNESSNYKEKNPPPDLQGLVTAVPRPDVVEVSIGSDDGLMKGHKLEVVRSQGGVATYVGRIVVLETRPDRAVCRPDPSMQRSPIQKDDRVFANLKGVQ
jgi:hypothetical protein